MATAGPRLHRVSAVTDPAKLQTGRTQSKKSAAGQAWLIDRNFCQDPESFRYLVSPDAGAEGLSHQLNFD
jgi:hypothetical protein